MQAKGLGGDIQLGSRTQAGVPEHGHAANDSYALESALHTTMNDTVMQQAGSPDTLKIARTKGDAASSADATPPEEALDEIYIDLKGNIVHKDGSVD